MCTKTPKASAESLLYLLSNCNGVLVCSTSWFQRVSGSMLDWINQTLSRSKTTGWVCPGFWIRTTICISFEMNLWRKKENDSEPCRSNYFFLIASFCIEMLVWSSMLKLMKTSVRFLNQIESLILFCSYFGRTAWEIWKSHSHVWLSAIVKVFMCLVIKVILLDSWNRWSHQWKMLQMDLQEDWSSVFCSKN